MASNKGATPGAILRATLGATPAQRPVNVGATHTPYTPSVAPAPSGAVHATDELRMWVPIARSLTRHGAVGGTFAFALCVTWFGWLL